MKDYKLSELKEICNTNPVCAFCPLYGLCMKLENSVTFYDLEIDDDEEQENER